MGAAVARRPIPFTERRRGRARHVKFTLADFKAIPHTHERNLTLTELADLSGIPKQKLLDIIPEHLDAFRVDWYNGYFVTYKEAQRFLRSLRLI